MATDYKAVQINVWRWQNPVENQEQYCWAFINNGDESLLVGHNYEGLEGSYLDSLISDGETFFGDMPD